MSELALVAPLSALTAGAVSFLSPCVLPLMPGYVAYIVGSNAMAGKARPTTRAIVTLSSFFVLGFSTVFVALGATATALGQLLASYRDVATSVGAVIVIGFGLFMIGVWKSSWLARDLRFHGAIRGGTPLGAYLLGLAFAFGWTPCIGPVLGTILTASALSTSASQGVLLLALYSIGLAVPFLLLAALRIAPQSRSHPFGASAVSCKSRPAW